MAGGQAAAPKTRSQSSLRWEASPPGRLGAPHFHLNGFHLLPPAAPGPRGAVQVMLPCYPLRAALLPLPGCGWAGKRPVPELSLLGTRFPVDTRKPERQKKTTTTTIAAARPAKRAGRDFQSSSVVVVAILMEVRGAFAWRLGGFLPDKCFLGRQDVATAEGRVNS